MTSTARRVIVCGFDGATFSLLDPLVEQGVMPNVAKAKRDGAWGVCSSTVPPVTAPAWTTCFTGVNPGKHGVFAFYNRHPVTGEPIFVSSATVRYPLLWQRLSRAGRSVGVVNVPITYPPEEVNGYMVTGMLTPAGRDYVFPSDLQEDLDGKGYRITVPLPREGDVPESLARKWLTRLYEVTSKRTETVLDLQQRFEPELSAVVYMTPDLIQHPFYKLLDPREPHHDSAVAERLRPHLHRCYGALDEALGALWSSLGDDDLMLVCSDHGFTGLRGRVFLNRWLAQEDYLKVRRTKVIRHESARIAKNRLARAVPHLRQNWGGAPEVFRDEFIDADRSIAMAGGASEYAVHLLRDTADVSSLRRGLLSIEDPATGAKVVEEVIDRERCYEGPWTQAAPHLLLQMSGDEYGFISRLWSRGRGIVVPKTGPVGTHHRDGIFGALGPLVRPASGIRVDLQDITPTVLYALGEPIPASADGRVVQEIFVEGLVKQRPPVISEEADDAAAGEDADAYSEADAEEIAQRLAALGYLE